jgi:Carboxypeptidase regulatory-like domain
MLRLRIFGIRVAALVSSFAAAASPLMAQGTGDIVGRVVDSVAVGVAGVSVSLDTLGLRATTDSTGHFRLVGAPAGRRMVSVRSIEIAPSSIAVAVDSGRTASTVIRVLRIATTVPVLPAVHAEAVGQFGKPARLAYTSKYDEFYQRRAMSTTGALFYTHEDLEKLGEADLPGMLEDIPGLRLQHDMDRNEISFPGCGTSHVLIKLNDQRVWPPDSALYGHTGNVPTPARIGPGYGSAPPTGGQHDDPLELIETLHLQNIEAMEIYKNVAELPVDAVGEVCAAVYIWTR